jgi:MSHA biogenesis protein MshJ
MNDTLKTLKTAAQKYNALTLRERSLFVFTIVVSICVVWWYFYAEPMKIRTKALVEETGKVSMDVQITRNAIDDIRGKIADGVNQDKAQKLVQLGLALEAVEERLRLKTIELIDPDKMFQLMTQLVYKESRLKLLSLKRREVKPAIALSEGRQDEMAIYRHLLEVKFSGKFLDILKYMQTLENLDWKLIWEEIEIVRGEYPLITVKIVISTLSTRKEWVGV